MRVRESWVSEAEEEEEEGFCCGAGLGCGRSCVVYMRIHTP